MTPEQYVEVIGALKLGANERRDQGELLNRIEEMLTSQPPGPPGILHRIGSCEAYQENQRVWGRRLFVFLTGGGLVTALVSFRYLSQILDALKAIRVP